MKSKHPSDAESGALNEASVVPPKHPPASGVVSIGQYDANEEVAKASLSFREIRAFSTRTFTHSGFPSQVKTDLELARYADWNGDPANREYFCPGRFLPGRCMRTDFTYDEAELINRVCDQTVAMTSAEIGRAVRPVCAPLAQVGLFRVVSALADIYQRHLRIFEVGPGGGYLGAYLINAGHGYAAMDHAQAFYLWQNRLLGHIARDDLSDWANSAAVPDSGKITRVVHLPWWKFLQFWDACPFDADLVIWNANSSEMLDDARKFLMRISLRMLRNSKLGMFLFSKMDKSRWADPSQIEAEFDRVGFYRVFQSKFSGFTLKGKLPRASTAFLERDIPLYNPSKNAKLLAAGDFLYLPSNQKPLDLRFTSALDDWSPPISTQRGMNTVLEKDL